eukprot:8684_1
MGLFQACPLEMCSRQQTSGQENSRSRDRNVNMDAPPAPPSAHTGYSGVMDRETMQLVMNIGDAFSPQSTVETEEPPIAYKYVLSVEETAVASVEENERLKTITKAKSIDEIRSSVLNNYSSVDYEDMKDFETSSSELDLEEKLHIQALQSTQKILSKPNVYRQDTPNEWEDNDIDHLRDEMSLHFLNLTRQASQEELRTLQQTASLTPHAGKMIQTSFFEADCTDDDDLPNSNLFRDASSENWKPHLVKQQRDEMAEQMIHLATLQSSSLDKEVIRVSKLHEITAGSESDFQDN